MTETSGMISGNRAGFSKPGSVGQPFTGAEVRLSDDGEILVRSDALLMAGYRNLPEKTAETIKSDGWLYTGDIGRIDDDGMITIIGRKKDIIITAGGKNISPANIEDAIRSATHLAGPVLVVGDRRSYIGAIISLDHDEVRSWARNEGLPYSDVAELVNNPRLQERIAGAVAEVNRGLSRPAQIKRFIVVAEQWDPGSGCVTPTLKIKRRTATELYSVHIEDLYDPQKSALTPSVE
jgi:long-subunit acyl-CoA synthetase (AMP-forming)